MTSSLVTYPVSDGTFSCGILYKPENFDPQKRYPIIFHYYDKLSAGLHGYLKPDFDGGAINIPYYVSNGYLVFTPDIHYRTGYTGRSAFRSIVAAALYLSKLPWVDKRRMGLQGHSFGGYETNYVVTHTSLFAAACSGSSWADFVSAYNDINRLGSGVSRQGMYEFDHERMGAPLWKMKSQYIENSPIFDADRVTTPLLMMNNKSDDDVSFHNGVAFFNALRRLGKKVWMLQYDGEKHAINDPIAAADFHIRMKQFFDHYLIGKPAPKWMVEGIPAKMKGIELGYELEPVGVEPGPGLALPASKAFLPGGAH
jgi:dipeptidyl aminopeptidase/acylaminoacyl peptidase